MKIPHFGNRCIGSGQVPCLTRVVQRPGRRRMLVLVLDLHADDRTAVLVEQTLDLRGNLVIEQTDIKQVEGVIGTDIQRLGKQPVRQAAIAHFPVAERSDADDAPQADLAAQFHESAQVLVSVPVENAFFGFMDIPEHVGRDHIDSSGFHLAQLLLPLLTGIAAVMELAQDRDERFPVHLHVETVDGDTAPGRRGSPQMEMVVADSHRLGRRIDGIGLLVRLSFRFPSSQDKGRITVGVQETAVPGKGQLTGIAVAPGNIHRLSAVHVPGIVFQHNDRRLPQGAPAERIEITCPAIDYDHFRIGVGRPVVEDAAPVIGRKRRDAFKGAFHEDIAVGGFEIAHPGEGSAPVPECTAVGKQASTAQDGIPASVHFASLQVNGTVGLQGIAVADDMHPIQGDAFPVQEQTFGLTCQIGGEGDVAQHDVRTVVEGHCRPPLRECSGPLVGLDRQGMGVENLVVGIMHPRHIGAGTEDDDIRLVADIDDLLVIAGKDPDDDLVGREIRNGIQGTLKRGKIAVSGSVDDKRIPQGRGFGGRREGPVPDAPERAGGDGQDAVIQGDPVLPPRLQHIVMRIDHGGVSPDQDRVEMERVRKAPDDRQLVIGRRGFRRAGRRSGNGIPVGRDGIPGIVVGNFRVVDVRCIGAAFRRSRRNGHVQTVHAFPGPGIEDPDPAGRSDGRYLVESHL